jgi:hypothetical protein
MKNKIDLRKTVKLALLIPAVSTGLASAFCFGLCWYNMLVTLNPVWAFGVFFFAVCGAVCTFCASALLTLK